MKYLKKLVILLIAPLSFALAHSNDWHMMNWGHMGNGTGGFIMFLIILLALIGVVAYFVVNRNKLREEYKEEETALEILKQRYAKGELTKQKYSEMKKDLG